MVKNCKTCFHNITENCENPIELCGYWYQTGLPDNEIGYKYNQKSHNKSRHGSYRQRVKRQQGLRLNFDTLQTGTLSRQPIGIAECLDNSPVKTVHIGLSKELLTSRI